MSDEKKGKVVEVDNDIVPQSLKEELMKEGKKFLYITIGIVILVIMNICLTTATIVLVVTRQNAPRQFPTNTLPLQRNGN